VSQNKIKALITSTRVKFVAYNLTYEARNDHPRFQEICDHLRANKPRAAVTAYRNGKKAEAKIGLRRDPTGLMYKELKLPPIFAEVYSNVMADGDPDRLKGLELFFDNILANPSTLVSMDAFARFLSRRKMIITDRGTFLAYKRLNYRFYDCHSNKFNNTPGIGFIEMPREDVDQNQHAECSRGFHQCSYEYVKSFPGEHLIVTEISPRDVVAVPPDYNFTKMRVCRYFPLCTIGEFKDLVRNYEQDVLSTLPFFHTHQLQRLGAVHARYRRENLKPESIGMYYPS